MIPFATKIELKYRKLLEDFKASYDKLDVHYENHKSEKHSNKNLNQLFENDKYFAMYYGESEHNLYILRQFIKSNKIFSIFSKLEEYSDNYNSGLKLFNEKVFDATEKQFIESQIDSLKKAITYFKLMENDLKHSFLAKLDYLNGVMSGRNRNATKKMAQLSPFETIYLLQEVGILNFISERYQNNKSKASRLLHLITDKDLKNLKTGIEILDKSPKKLSSERKKIMEKINKLIKDNRF